MYMYRIIIILYFEQYNIHYTRMNVYIVYIIHFFFFNEPALSRILRIYIYYVEKQFFPII